MSCDGNNTIDQADIDNIKNSADAIAEWVQGGPTDSTQMPGGPLVPSPSKVIADAKLFKAPVVYSAATQYTDATQPVDQAGVIYAPLPAALPIGPEAFDPANWYVLQGVAEETGTFTPSIEGTIVAGTPSSYLTQSGTYTKIGREWTIRISLGWTGHTGTGGIKITGLPVPPVASRGDVTFVRVVGYTNTAGRGLRGYVESSSTDVVIITTNDGVDGAAAPIDADVDLLYLIIRLKDD